jgi:hypothetical protein
MGEKNKNTIVSLGHIIVYVAFFLFVFWVGFVLFMWVVVSQQALVKMLWHPLVMVAILGFDCSWVIAMKFWSKKPLQTKVIYTLLLLTVSCSYFACWIYGQIAGGMHY